MAVIMDYSIFGQNIRRHRKEQNLTQEALAEKAGVCYQFLGHLERGNAIPSVQTVMSLCDALNITANDLLNDCAMHDPNPPCRLRDDTDVFGYTLSDMLYPTPKTAIDVEEWLHDLPEFDVTLPDIDEFPRRR